MYKKLLKKSTISASLFAFLYSQIFCTFNNENTSTKSKSFKVVIVVLAISQNLHTCSIVSLIQVTIWKRVNCLQLRVLQEE